MKIFDETIAEVNSFLKEKKTILRTFECDSIPSWHGERKRDVILKKDIALELGNPQSLSASYHLISDKSSAVHDGRITIIGPDFSECKETSIPFGKIVIAYIKDLNEENFYDRYQMIDLARYDPNLEGYMMRGVSQNLQEWSRISKKAVGTGFNLKILGKEMLELYKTLSFIESVEIIFITSSSEDVQRVKKTGEESYRYVMAMRKMIEEIDLNCGDCGFIDICGDAGELRSMRKKIS